MLKIAVDGLSTEVRSISNHIKQGGLRGGGSSGQAAMDPSNASRKHGNKRQQAAAECSDDDYAADSEEVEKLTLPARARSAAQNQLAVRCISLIPCDWTLTHECSGRRTSSCAEVVGARK